ncbi:uncharacterized protein THITE_2114441 [Thermothielavioides terrestris NRRL 8126]|uniref:FCH domain-containing protein n=1 Tax=Thermothielavioides terrestris (strain ATCC 38088 / NRRL 8126) TaxID=578455 RepID=G2QZP6_THETT|nr:uncharacterized protein THITE_2114441 [Thermothielavioides terrestris NRRL 8126]AEO66375.1 hypothetical protein THITE_2114441 [Thermothielavioides terrestris NRRL 8126]
MAAAVEDLSRSEYPAMLANLQPGQAVQVLADRVKRIARTNQEIADWLQERRRVEEQYVASLRKLLLFKVPNAASELGVFQAPWDKILQSVDGIAASHQLFSQRIEKDVEQPLRNFQNRKDMQNIHTMSANLQSMAKELDEATEKSERLSKKGGKANVQKVDMAAARLESANSQWESQAPFIFETLQALDEQRINHLRDVLTQLETHEIDQATRTQSAAEDVLNVMLEVDTSREVQNFVQRTTSGKPRVERKSTSRQPAPVTPSVPPPSATGDDVSEHSGHRENPPELKLRSRIGTMLGRRRQSIHGGFGQLGSSQKGLGPFSRGLGSSHSQTLSPRTSSHNLADSQNRLTSVVESPTAEKEPRKSTAEKESGKPSHEGTNGVAATESPKDVQPPKSTSLLNGTAEDIFDAPAAPSAPQQQQEKGEPTKDAEGFTIPTATNDPISQAQREAAAEEGDLLFKLSIKNEPIPEEDQEAKQAALSNVANALTTMGMPSRRTGTVRGRREVRNTVYMPALPTHEISADNPFPPSPSLSTSASIPRPTPSATFASETSHASDTQSIRSGTSFGGASSYSTVARLKHPEMHGPAYGPGLHSSIIEAVSAVFQDGEPSLVKVTGEIALSYVPDPNSPYTDRETIRLNGFSLLESIGPNRVVVANTAAPDEFSVGVSHLTTATTPAFTYRVHAESDTALASQCPITILPVWKPQADKLGLLLQYRLNPSCAAAATGPVTLSNVVFIAAYEGARASGVQTKPSGTHLKDKHIVYWRLGDLTLTEDWGKIICRVIGEQNAEPRPGRVEVRWEWASPPALSPGEAGDAEAGSGISVARLLPEGKGKGKEKAQPEEENPFADVGSAPASPDPQGRTWVDVPLVRRVVSGKYEAKQTL